MTTLTTNYSFMDLMKDKNNVPQIDQWSDHLFADIKSAYVRVSGQFNETTSTYNFMDLMKDHGNVPFINEPSIFDELEESINQFVDEVADYTFIDLLKAKGYAFNAVPVAANDNQRLLRLAS